MASVTWDLGKEENILTSSFIHIKSGSMNIMEGYEKQS